MHPAWDTLPQRIVCTQVVSASPDDYDWRLMCPIRRTWNQVLFWIRKTCLPCPEKCSAEITRGRLLVAPCGLYFKLLKFQEERGDLEEKPEGPSDADYEILKRIRTYCGTISLLAARGVLDIDQIEKAFPKQYSRNAC